MSSGGPGSGLFKSTDGGDTWTEITRNPGLPAGLIGKIGVARVRRRLEPRLRAGRERERRPLPLRRCRRDVEAGERRPQHPAARVLLHARLRRSEEQGHRLHAEHERVPLDRRRQDAAQRSAAARTATHHDLWIDPDDPQHVRPRATTAAARSSTNASSARHWTRAGLPDGAVLPRDHHDARAVSRLRRAAGQQRRCACRANAGGVSGAAAAVAAARRAPPTYSAGGGEAGYIAPDPKDPDVFFSGSEQRRRSSRGSTAAPAKRAKSARTRASSPASRRARDQGALAVDVPDHLLAGRSERALHRRRSTSGRRPTAARRWDRISGDLTRHDPKTMGLGRADHARHEQPGDLRDGLRARPPPPCRARRPARSRRGRG